MAEARIGTAMGINPLGKMRDVLLLIRKIFLSLHSFTVLVEVEVECLILVDIENGVDSDVGIYDQAREV